MSKIPFNLLECRGRTIGEFLSDGVQPDDIAWCGSVGRGECAELWERLKDKRIQAVRGYGDFGVLTDLDGIAMCIVDGKIAACIWIYEFHECEVFAEEGVIVVVGNDGTSLYSRITGKVRSFHTG